MVSTTGNEVATVTQLEQNPAIGNEGNEAGAGAEAVALPPRHTGPHLKPRHMSLRTTRDSSRQHKNMSHRL